MSFEMHMDNQIPVILEQTRRSSPSYAHWFTSFSSTQVSLAVVSCLLKKIFDRSIEYHPRDHGKVSSHSRTKCGH